MHHTTSPTPHWCVATVHAVARQRKVDEVVSALGFAQPEMKRCFGANACIVATRVAVEVLRACNIRAQPLPVHVEVFNAAAAAHVEAGRSHLVKSDPAAWSARLGFTGETQADGLLDAHVVAVVQDEMLVDLTLDQCTAPERGVLLSPGVFYGLPKGFTNGGRQSYPVNDGCVVVYEAHPEEKTFFSTPDWTDRVRRQPFVDATLARIGAVAG